ncbi:hypothetical protein AKO1_002067 [Acrasis kona]|uniref:F-box domain-containing protein n=1 Tax=Acrasis kona TaxID=1008807 RepID=A0AAW2YPI9_9EUKA
MSPPSVRLLTKITRPHVYDAWICLDLLETHRSLEPYYGWSTSYSITSILLQLQSFLLGREESDVESEMLWLKPSLIEKAIDNSRTFVCSCGHDISKNIVNPRGEDWPDLVPEGSKSKKVNKAPKSNKQNAKPSQRKVKAKFTLHVLPNEVLLHIFEYLDVVELNRVSKVSIKFQSTSNSPMLRYSNEMQCFHSKISFKEDMLGVGINMEYTPMKILQSITTPMDLVSKSAYQQGLRQGVWKEKFKYWIPIYINKFHADTMVKDEFEKAVQRCYDSENISNRRSHIATLSVDILCKLMSSMVVEIMKGRVHASLKALEYYCHFHRLLIHVVLKYKGLQEQIDNKIKQFLSDESSRLKSAVPNLGEFLPLLSVSNYEWFDVKHVVIQESLDRNAMWIYKKHRYSATLEDKWKCYRVGSRLMMFHAYFLTKVVPPGKPLDEIARAYDIRYGRPTNKMQNDMQNNMFYIQSIDTYEEYLAYLSLTVRDVRQLLMLSTDNMFRKKYLVIPGRTHRPSGVQHVQIRSTTSSSNDDKVRMCMERRTRARTHQVKVTNKEREEKTKRNYNRFDVLANVTD